MVLVAGSAFADEILHCAVFGPISGGSRGGYQLLREQMKRMKGKTSPPRVGERLFLSFKDEHKDKDTGFFTYRGKLSTSGKTRLEFSNWFNCSLPRRDLFDAGVTVGVTKSGDAAAALYSFDLDYLDTNLEDGDYFRARTTGLPVPVRPNEWIEVAKFHHGKGNNFSCQIWLYLETAELAPPAEIPAQEQSYGNDPKAAYRLDIVFGALPEATVRMMHTFGREHTRLTVMAIHEWETYSVICQSEKPFRFDAGRGDLAKIKNPIYTASRLTQVEGELMVYESSMTLVCQTIPAVERRKDALVIPFRGEVAPGAWVLQEVKDGPKTGDLKPRFTTGMVARDNSVVNVAAYRITKL